MNTFFNKIKEYWENNGFEAVVTICIVIIIILCIYNIIFKKNGTYSEMALLNFKKRSFNNNNSNNNSNSNNIEYIQHTPNDSKLELQCKLHLENIFKIPFYKIRPNFLRNEVTGYNLEIDLYNDDLKLGVEVQGDQHYKFTPFFHRNKETFMLQRYRDEMKKEKCKKEGITLIEIPYKVGEKGLKKYLITQLRINGYLL
jgi:hypothetical protein